MSKDCCKKYGNDCRNCPNCRWDVFERDYVCIKRVKIMNIIKEQLK